MTNLNVRSTPQLSKGYILQSTAVTYSLCPAIVTSAGIAQHFPYLVLLHLDCLISSCRRFLWLREWWIFDTYKSPVIYTRPLEMKAVVFPAAEYAACLTRRLSFNQEELTPANVATDVCPALSYQSAPSRREWPGCCMLETTLWFLQSLEYYRPKKLLLIMAIPSKYQKRKDAFLRSIHCGFKMEEVFLQIQISQ